MKKISLILFSFFIAQMSFSQSVDFKFNPNGEFKILQLTDTHVTVGKNNQQHVMDLLATLVQEENPDLVVFTGDVVTDSDNPKPCYEIFAEFFKRHKLHWAVTLGNHDSENKMPRNNVASILDGLDFCINRSTDSLKGTNFLCEVKSSTNSDSKAVLYFLDSQDYSTIKPRVDGYGWFSTEQVVWYKEQSQKFIDENKDTIPALAFFHIPLPEYTDAWCNGKAFGTRKEVECCSKINSGMFGAMVEQGDVMGTFVGHDHVNDYVASYYNMALAYGRASGAKNSYGDLKQGGRVIVLKEGKRTFDTWIREKDGEIKQVCNFPDSFQ
ncbi:phosphohydrolase [Labilibaculum sp. A4]|uniref:metallophosphoesterase family protein n=1 Tax=Labilibaculum euxinus TaxID=2686357 RepID=UPI000F61831F|nr:metallophosphoesterase family protein [Labilibaculum euxinus]MDQ1771265.1 metallophosphoesterase family protein [Labilibaculum euxinus]MWN77052.1 phosphohydrolase [Labilibaculum euxinus]